MMKRSVLAAVLLPFLGTALGAGGVCFLRGAPRPDLGRALSGFAAGVMTAASVWSLLLPAIEQSAHLGALAFFPAFAGVWGGFLFLLALSGILPRLARRSGGRGSTAMMVLAVTLHNLPEGMAVGVAAAGYLSGRGGITAGAMLILALGIALQNLPEGAIVSMPLQAEGMKRPAAFGAGVLSGVVEPVGAAAAIWLAGVVVPALPWLLGFAAGAMLYVAAAELLPDMARDGDRRGPLLLFAAGFTVMMAMDVALG